MAKIKLLPEELINKIAAGEVVERPASIVKELIENALDAGCTSLVIKIKNYGKDLISITDNGEGMSADDARSSIIRHATSKIQTFTDLYNLHTLGFRGEALASIAAVSELSIITRTKDASRATKIECHGGVMVTETTAAHNTGTTLEVRNLFFNTPARKKFLKSDAVEMSHIVDITTNYALLNPLVDFMLIHENHEILHAPRTDDFRSRIGNVYGFDLATQLLEFNLDDGGSSYKIHGFISKPYDCRGDKNIQTIFINNRYIRNNDITKAIYEGYHARLFVGKHPVFVIYITVDPLTLDVNIHPQKTEVKIEHKEGLISEITRLVLMALESADVIPMVEVKGLSAYGSRLNDKECGKFKYAYDQSMQKTLGVPDFISTEEGGLKSDVLHKNYTSYGSTNNNVTALPGVVAESHVGYRGSNGVIFGDRITGDKITGDKITGIDVYNGSQSAPLDIRQDQDCSQDILQDVPQDILQDVPQNTRFTLPAFTLFGQFHKTFWVAETAGGIFFFDQHAVHERVMYDRFMQEKVNKNVRTQQLLCPVLIKITPTQNIILQEYKSVFFDLGFQFDQIGPVSYMLRSIPFVFERAQPKELLFEVLDSIAEGSVQVVNKGLGIKSEGRNTDIVHAEEEKIITRMACRAAIKAGDEITKIEFEKIIGLLRRCDFPFTCPHGRPSIIKVTADELEKKFRRRG